MGISYGAAIVSEGVFHDLSDEQIKNSGITFSYDEHGHPELGKLSKAHIFNEVLEKKLKSIGLKVKSRPCEVGYEVRCVDPNAFDLVYCSQMGLGVYSLFKEGHSGCMVFVDNHGRVKPLFLKDLQNKQGKIPPRLVDINNQSIQNLLRNNLQFITDDDYDAAREYVDNPEEFDFYQILNWKK
jgi:6-phosphofructokinase 1